ncbi:serine/threonine-protein kinase 31-like isoform X2 [Physella acuta]|uniref:serine/threonine-protein kinase 31-like isoform X2 n=1 Tax=Physella acuta TaxID=109671 RepID=UPI0027DEA3F4|nr:serine/threonine-protein kinase 31-like isoform X2 [Physella acuta]
MSSGLQTRKNQIPTTYDVFVGNLPADADHKKVGKVFSKFGEVHNIWINNSSDGNKFGIIKFYCEEDCLKAIEETNGMVFENGNKILVKKAVKRGMPVKKDGDMEDKCEKEDNKQTMFMKQRNPDIVPTFEAVPVQQNRRDMERVLITHIETPVMMWGQKVSQDNITELNGIVKQLAIICPEAPKLMGKPETDKIYGAKFSEDQCWYRCIVRYIYSIDRVKVQYVDFGNTEELDPSTLVELPKSLTAPPSCAVKYMLHSLWCNSNQDAMALKFLRELVEGKEVDVCTTARLSDQMGFFAEMYCNGVSVNEKMLENGYAFKKPGLDQRGVKPRVQGPTGDGTVNNVNLGMKGTLPNVRDGPRKFESDKDEISNLRWKLKNLQTEYTSLSNKAQENDLSSQIKNLQALSSLVRKLRNQFPMNKETPLDCALALIQAPGKIKIQMVQSLPDAHKSIKVYRNAQDEIIKCSDPALLIEKTVARDLLRKDLHDKLSLTIGEISKVSLKDRGKQVQDVVSSLTKHYDTFTKYTISQLPPVDRLLPTFEEWKMKKKNEIIGARLNSDSIECSVNSVLDQLKNSISLNPDVDAEDLTEDLDATLKYYTKALQQEVAIAETENSCDAIFLATLVQTLLNELKDEANAVDQLYKVLHEFTKLKEDIAPWLETKPCTEELQAVRLKLKNLKSKLRHKLADKVDAEENHDASELEQVARDLENIRSNIHKALKEEDRIMVGLSDLARAHFPELISADSDIGFSTYLTYNGLVKLSHSPDQYKLSSVGNSLSGMFISQLDNEPVFIKEYFLGSSKLGKDEILSQMALYSNASSPFLEPVYAVFFDKDSRHMYVEVKKNGELLSTLVESGSLSKQQCQSIVNSLCKALQALHLFNFVHGQVQPEYVVVDEEGTAKLLPPNFTLTDDDRCHSKYSTSSGIELMAPEMKQNKMSFEPAHVVDVYCLGLLTLWMHYPNVSFVETRDGGVDFSFVPLDYNLNIFLQNVLKSNPLHRPTAENCLRSEYLCQSIGSDTQGAIFGENSFGQDSALGRNSASPASVLSQSSNDCPVLSESGPQIMVNTRIPPPSIPLEGQGFTGQSNLNNSSQLALNLQQPAHFSQSAHQNQMHLQQHQYQQYQLEHLQHVQQQQFTEQNPAIDTPDLTTTHDAADGNGVFEIGTFDPNAYEVVTSPQPLTAVRTDEENLIATDQSDKVEIDGNLDDDDQWVEEDEN